MKYKKLIPVLLTIMIATMAFASSKPGKSQGIENDPFTFTTFRDIASKYSDSVVNISTTTVLKPRRRNRRRSPMDDFMGDDFFRHFFEPQQTQPRKLQSLGSGVIIDSEGYILTNNHVVEDVDQVKVTLLNGDTYDAEVIGTDTETDIGLIKIEPDSPIKAIPLGDSDIIVAGDWVMAIGNPFGFGHTVTVGVVSATRRSMVMPRDELPYQDFIQTDASINPGNSGGPLLDIHGRLIGINTVIASRTGQSAGIGFSIPINMIEPLLDDLKTNGSVTRGWMGVTIQTVNPALAKHWNLESTKGAVISELVEGAPAEEAGIKPGDVILKYNGIEIRDSSHLSQVVASSRVDEKIKIELMRDGKLKTISMVVGTRPDDALNIKSESGVTMDLGMSVQNITDDIARQLRLASTDGVLISKVRPGGAADNADLRRGDIILEVNRTPVKDVNEYRNVIKKLMTDEGAVLYIQRGNSRIFVPLEPEKE